MCIRKCHRALPHLTRFRIRQSGIPVTCAASAGSLFGDPCEARRKVVNHVGRSAAFMIIPLVLVMIMGIGFLEAGTLQVHR